MGSDLTFEEKAHAVAADLYPDGIPDLPPWFPEDVIASLEQQSPGGALLARMVAADGVKPDTRLGQMQWCLVFLWIGLEAGDQKRIDFTLDDLLGTSGRGWLANRMRKLGLDRTDLEHELAVLCTELLQSFAKSKSRIDDGAAAFGYFRNAFRNRLEGWIDRQVRERQAQADITEIAPPMEQPGGGEIALLAAIERADLSECEDEAVRLLLAGHDGQAVADAMGVEKATAETFARRARKKIEGAL